ncbi:MAG: peptide-methionine (S)-S-oxide reductase MsrA, partial [Pseudomonadota bacterium]
MAFFSFSKNSNAMDVASSIQNEIPENAAKAVLAGGCFWCVESEFRSIDGVLYTISGYTGGDVENPTYKDITTGKSGHAEATEIYYDPNKVTYEELLDYFLRVAHDPTQKNRQGVDVGTQYRSAIFYESEDQKRQALA